MSSALVLPLYALPQSARAEEGDLATGATVVGELVQAQVEHELGEDPAEGADDSVLTWVETAEGDSVRLSTDDVEDLAGELTGDPEADVPIGATVEVVVGDEVAPGPGEEPGLEPAREVLAAEVVQAAPEETAAAGEVVTNEVTVVMVVPPGGVAEPGRTLQQVMDAVNGPVSDFWWQQSGGTVRVRAAAAAYDWAAGSYDCSSAPALWTEAATRASFTAGPGKHLLVYLPRNSTGCAYGLAQLGTSTQTGGRLYVTDVETSLIAHELGHNFSLGHSNAKQCDGGTETGSCQDVAYRDYYDVMAASGPWVGALSAPQAARIGVLPAGQQQTVTWDGTAASYTLSPISGTAGLRGLRLAGPNGVDYWLEYRTATGQDAWLGTSTNRYGLQQGVLVRRMVPGANETFLLDATPSSAASWPNDWATALPAGAAVLVADQQFAVTVESMDATSAVVRVSADPGTTPTLPLGNFEALSAAGSTLSVHGWALDLNSRTISLPIRVSVDGAATTVTANGSRPDIGATYQNAGDAHGFSFSTAVAPGPHQVCVSAADADQPWRSASLGCRSITTQLALPVGNWEALTASGSTLTVGGWTFDPDDGGRPVQVHVYVDGRNTVTTADQSRPDVRAAFPAAGGATGYSVSTPVLPGEHRVCVYAIDMDLPWRNTAMGCRTISTQVSLPVGNWEALSASGQTLTVGGWTFDPDSPADAAEVHVYVDGRNSVIAANRSRPDVGNAFPQAGASHGFSMSVPVPIGEHRVCVYVIDRELPWRNTAMGCRTITTQLALPMGNWEALSASGPTLTLGGWAIDPDDGTRAVPVHVYVDGQLAPLTADQSRPDVGAAFPAAGSAHGFGMSIPVAPGQHRVCVYAIDADLPWRNIAMGCRSIDTQLTLPVGNWEVLSATGSTVTIGGWTFDPDSPTAAAEVHVYVNGRISVTTADRSRPDVGGAFPQAGPAHGFSLTGAVGPGNHTVCVYVIDREMPGRNTAMGCRAITVGLALPVGNWETLATSGATLNVGGWAFDPDNPTAPAEVHIYIDGQIAVTTANQSRPDVGAVFPQAGDSHGFGLSRLMTTPGAHRVCVYVIDAELPWRNTAMGCRDVTVPPMTAAEAIQGVWVEWGAETGALGPAAAAVQGGLARGGSYREFQHGAIYWSPATGAQVVLDGLIRADWDRIGAEGSGLGYPTSDTFCGLIDYGCGQEFEGGVLYVSNSTGVQMVAFEPFLEAWAQSGWEEGPFGYPTSSAQRYGDGHVEQAFQNAYLYWTERDGVTVIY